MLSETLDQDAPTMAPDGRGGLLAGRYRVVKPLGQGGMGSVWLAENIQLDNRPCAIKMLPSVLVANKRAYAQLKAEALVSLKLVHPNIVALRAFEENNGNPFLVMDYIKGQTLDDYLAEKGTLSEAEVVTLLRPIAAALDYAHGEKVVHRDVKPANVMIRQDGHPFILDFGIAREIQETLTRVTGKLSSGTLLYMSPEQLNGLSPKPAQDVYSFAAMVYECLKGQPPFCRGQIEHQILNNTPEPLASHTPLAKAVMRGLAKTPEARPKTCLEVLAGKSGSEAPGEAPERNKTRHGAGRLVGLLVVLAALAGGSGYYVWHRHKAALAEQEAARQRQLQEQERAEKAKKAKEEADKKAAEEAERQRQLQEQADREKKEEEEAEHQRMLQEQERAEKEKKAKAEADKKAAEDAERQRQLQEQADREKKEKEAAERLRKLQEQEQAEKERKAKEAADKKAAEEAERQRKLQEQADREKKAKEEAAEAERQRKLQEQADKEKKAAEQAERQRQAEFLQKLDRHGFILDTGNNPHKPGETGYLALPDGSHMRMRWCPPGWFMMGSPKTETSRIENEGFETRHPVRITRGFWMSETEVTEAQWNAVMGYGGGGNAPKRYVSWDQCHVFADRLNQRSHGGLAVRLPTEAEWEYACRAGTSTPFSFGTWLNGKQACCAGGQPYGTTQSGPNAKIGPSRVGSYSAYANAWGLNDMHGNVYEWCEDTFGPYPTNGQLVVDPANRTAGGVKVIRGGCWNYAAHQCRSAWRGRMAQDLTTNTTGFRVCYNDIAETPKEQRRLRITSLTSLGAFPGP